MLILEDSLVGMPVLCIYMRIGDGRRGREYKDRRRRLGHRRSSEIPQSVVSQTGRLGQRSRKPPVPRRSIFAARMYILGSGDKKNDVLCSEPRRKIDEDALTYRWWSIWLVSVFCLLMIALH